MCNKNYADILKIAIGEACCDQSQLILRIFFIQGPLKHITGNVISNIIQFSLIADDAVVKSWLPFKIHKTRIVNIFCCACFIITDYFPERYPWFIKGKFFVGI
jgi:hypothetical protein